MKSPAQEHDRLATKRLTVVVLACAVFAGAGISVSGSLGRASAKARKAPTSAPSAQIGIVEQTLIGATERGVALRRAQRKELERFGWVDEPHGIATIPIDRAVKIVVERTR